MRYQRLLGWVAVGGAVAATAVAVNQYRWRARIDALQNDRGGVGSNAGRALSAQINPRRLDRHPSN